VSVVVLEKIGHSQLLSSGSCDKFGTKASKKEVVAGGRNSLIEGELAPDEPMHNGDSSKMETDPTYPKQRLCARQIVSTR
jgi:hypothetical protein